METFWLQWLHLVAAMVWVGGQLFLPLALTPVLKRRFPPEQRVELIAAVGTRFRPFAWVALGILVLTGLQRASLVFGGFPELWQGLSSTDYGQILKAKLLLVIMILLLQLLHDFVLGPRLQKLSEQRSPGLARARAATIGIALGSVLLSLVIVGLAANLRLN